MAKEKETVTKKTTASKASIKPNEDKGLSKGAKKGSKTIKPGKKVKQKKEKKPKGRVRIGPLVLVIVLVAGGIVFERLFLDMFVKNLMVSVIESEYGAKCDIENVDLELMDGSLVVENFALADKASPMKNLFEFSRSSIDFDMTQVFLGRFVADELSIEGVLLGTERETSGELKRIIPEAEPKEDTKEGKFALAISDSKQNLSSNSKNIIEQAVETYNPENMLSSYLENLQIPEMIDAAEKTVEDITVYWQNAAPNLEESGNELFDSVEEVQALLDSDTIDAGKIRDGISSIQNLVEQGQALQNQVSQVSERLERDIDTVGTLSDEIESAIRSDTNFIQSEIEKITSFTFSDAQGMVSSTFEGLIVGILGDYYPTVQKVLDVLSNVKAASSEEAQEEKQAFERLRGRTIQFNAQMPSFLIRNVTFSGSDSGEWVSVSGFAHDISNDPDLIQKPAVANLDLSLADFSGKLDAIVDLRTLTDSFPVELDFEGSGLDTNSFTSSSTLGVPSIGGDADIEAALNFELAGDFEATANFDFNPALLSVESFEPNTVYEMYSNILRAIESFYVQSDIVFSLENGMNIALDTDADKKIADGLATALNAEIVALKENLQVEADSYLSSYTDGFMARVEEFDVVGSSMQDLQSRLGNFDDELAGIQEELEGRLRDQAGGAVKDGVQEAASGLLKGLF